MDAQDADAEADANADNGEWRSVVLRELDACITLEECEFKSIHARVTNGTGPCGLGP